MLRGPTILALLALFSVLTVVNKVSRKKMIDAFGEDYAFFRQELTNLLYNLYASFVCIFRWRSGAITSEMIRFPLYKLAIVSISDGMSDFLGSVGGVWTPGTYQVLISQTAIVFTMIAGFLFLRMRFHSLAVCGALLTIAGAALAIVPGLLKTSSSGGHQSSTTRPLSVAIFSLSNIPAASSYLATEVFLKGTHSPSFDLFYLTAVTSWIQLALTWLLVPLTAIKGMGGIPMGQIGRVFRDGAMCFFGVQVVEGRGDCSGYTTWITMLFSLSGFFAGIVQLVILQQARKGAVLCAVANSVMIPISSLAFSMRAVMGDDAEPLTPYTWGGLAVVVAGFSLYTYFGKLKRSKQEEEAMSLRRPPELFDEASAKLLVQNMD
jgi:drug/metabolite transporter (DMT)-like permease